MTDLATKRIAQGLTQQNVASKAGVSGTTVWKLENGNSVSPRVARLLAPVYGVSIDAIPTRPTEPHPSPVGPAGDTRSGSVAAGQ